ncbi:hypothetical protein ACWEOW_13465 [Monashia sp. NPDC004114]
MARHTQGARALALGLGSALLATIALAAPVAAAGRDAYRQSVRGRTGDILAAAGGSSVQAPTFLTSAPGTRKGLGMPSGRASTDALSAGSSVAAQATCDWTVLEVDQLAERSVLHVSWAGAASVVIQRQRNQGALRTLGTLSGGSGRFVDKGINQRAAYWYRLTAKDPKGVSLGTCDSGLLGMSTDGHSLIDNVVAGTGLYRANPWGLGESTVSGTFVAPAFSADGRLYAATHVDEVTGKGVLEVRRAATDSVAFTIDLGDVESPADPAFSPDGQTLAYTRYRTVDGAPLGLGFVDVHGSHVKSAATYDVPVAEPSWRGDNSTLVVSSWDAAMGLAVVCRTCATVSPLSGTAGGYSPEVASDGSVFFAITTDTSSTLNKRTTSGAVSTIRSSATDVFALPRLAPDGTLFYERDVPDDPVSPTSWHVQVMEIEAASPNSELSTWIGETPGYSGYDVRQPQSKGTSDFAGDAHDELVARDTSGVLRAYDHEGFLTPRVTQIGTGWGGFTAILPLDLTSDDRADLVARDASGVLWLYRGLPGHKFAARVKLGTGWGGYLLVAPGDWNGDDVADLLGRDASGNLWLYPGTGRGTLAPRRQIGSGWGGMTSLVGSGDIDLDNRPDLMARDKAGNLWLYPGSGVGGFQTRRSLGTGWGSFTALAVTEPTNQYATVFVRTSTGRLQSYTTHGDGAIWSATRTDIYTGWNGWLVTA